MIERALAWWRGQARGRKIGVTTVAVLLLLLAAGGVVGVLQPTDTIRAKPVSVPRPPSSQNTNTPGTPTVPADSVTVDTFGREYVFELDEFGMIVMPATDDVREAAAAAGAAFYTFDGAKITNFSQFREKLFENVTQPSPEYVGPTGQIHTAFDPAQPENNQYLRPAQGLEDTFINPSLRNEWWALGIDGFFAGQATLGAQWKATPTEVYLEEEIKVVDAETRTSADWATRKPSDDMTLTKDGAKLFATWVLLDIVETVGQQTFTHQFAAPLMMYCDPPEESGQCALATTLTSFPKSWPRPQ